MSLSLFVEDPLESTSSGFFNLFTILLGFGLLLVCCCFSLLVFGVIRWYKGDDFYEDSDEWDGSNEMIEEPKGKLIELSRNYSNIKSDRLKDLS